MDLNETYDFLMQIRRKEIIIRRKETQRDELRACLLPGAVRYDRDKVQSTPTDKMSDVMARVDELDREIEQLRREKPPWSSRSATPSRSWKTTTRRPC